VSVEPTRLPEPDPLDYCPKPAWTNPDWKICTVWFMLGACAVIFDIIVIWVIVSLVWPK
jgi:hypothetical protein